MAATDTVIIQGKCKWAHTKRPNRFGDYSIDIYPNEPSLKIVEGLIKEGIMNRLKKDDDGYYIRFKRPTAIKSRKTQQLIPLDPPQVIDSDRRHLDVFIGNGSDVSVLLEVYGGKNPMGNPYKAARFKGVKVENLVPFTSDSIQETYDHNRLKALEEAPVQEPVW